MSGPEPGDSNSEQVCPVCAATFAGRYCPRCVLNELLASDGGAAGDDSSSFLGGLTARSNRVAHYVVELTAEGRPRELGRGGMGVAFKAFDERLKVPVVLKVILPARELDPAARALFLREARAAARIRNSHVASVLYLHDEPPHFFYAMEYVDGRTLADWMRARGRVKPVTAVELVSQIAIGLGAIHAEGIVHRDLKPTNIMVTEPAGREEFLAKIIDFGLARDIERHGSETQSVGFRGTVIYASPEQCDECPDLDGRSDLYSLGCILFQLLTGAPPFAARTHRELLNHHLTSPLPLERLHGQPLELKRLVIDLLQKKREDRVPDTKTALARLGALARTLPPETEVPAAAGRRRGRLRPILVGAGLAGLAGVAYWLSPPTTVPPVPGQPEPSVTPGAAGGAAARSLGERGLVVLPLTLGIAPTPAGAGLADALHDDLTTSLAMVPGLRVIAKTSAMRSAKTTDVRELAQKLGVAAVLEGSLQSLDPVRWNLRLIDCSSEGALWTQRFERPAAEVPQTQVEMTEGIAGAMGVALTDEVRRRIAHSFRAPPGAIELYQRARSLIRLARGPDSDLKAAEELLLEALKLEPKLAKAQAQLSILLTLRYDWGTDRTDRRLGQALEAAEAAAFLEPDSAETQLALGTYYLRCLRDFARATKHLDLAAKAEPQNSEILAALANVERRRGRWEEALVAYRKALSFSPLDPILHYNYVYSLTCLQRYEEADAALQAGSRLVPNHLGLGLARSELYLNWKGDIEPMRETANSMVNDGARSEFRVMELVRVALFEKKFAEARRVVEESNFVLLDSQILFRPRAAVLAEIATVAGDKAEAFRLWNQVAQQARPMVQARPEDPRLGILLAQAWVGCGELGPALEEAARVLSLKRVKEDDFERPYYEEAAAVVSQRAGKIEEAQEVRRRLSLPPSPFSEHYFQLAPQWHP